MLRTLKRQHVVVTLLIVITALGIWRPHRRATPRPPSRRRRRRSLSWRSRPCPRLRPAYLQFLGTDGTRLYAEHQVNGLETGFVRLDRGTGEIVAEYKVRDYVPGLPYDPGTSWTISPDGVVVLDGDRKTVAVLDSDTLEVRRRVPLPKNTRPALPPHSQNAGPVWVGHKSLDFDSFRGVYTRRATTLIDVKKARAVKTIDLPACGSKGGVQPARTTLVLHLECSHQLAVIDLPTGKKQLIPAFQLGADISLIGNTPWFRWNELGYLAAPGPGHRQAEDARPRRRWPTPAKRLQPHRRRRIRLDPRHPGRRQLARHPLPHRSRDNEGHGARLDQWHLHDRR